MNIISSVAQGLPIAAHVIPAIAAAEITLSGFIRKGQGQIGFEKLSAELGAAALYGLASITPIPYISYIATTIFVGYSLLSSGRKEDYMSSKLIVKLFDLTMNGVVVPFCEHVLSPVAGKITQLMRFVWKHCGDTITMIAKKIEEVIKPVLSTLNRYLIKPAMELLDKIFTVVWDFGKVVVRNILKPLADLTWAIVRPILEFVGSALAHLAFIPETFFNHPRWTAFAILAVASIAIALK